jgi:predicted NAD/FAD-dependent oxidoreductase
MQPCWTLMGISDEPEAQPRWDLMRPPAGLLAGALRNDSRPGRAAVAGQGQWVTHARPGWSRQHLEQPAEWVQQQMQTALDDCWGARIDWLHCTVHRWRYAHAATHASAAAAPFWWDARRGLGVCGDFLGGNGVEGAWLSAQALSAALLQPAAAGGERLAAQRVPADVGAP